MFKYPKTFRTEQCKACNEPIDEDSASFVDIGDERLKSMNKPLIVFFLYSGDGSISDKICLDCFEKFKDISQFYNLCKNSQSQYTPCFGDSSRSETPRILSTVTPDLSASESKRVCPSSELLSSSSRSIPTQTLSSTAATQAILPKEKKKFPIHHDLGIRLPKPILREKGCFDESDLCYSMLKDEFDQENGRNPDETLMPSDNHPSCGKRIEFPPISTPEQIPTRRPHTHVAKCPFCPALIHKKHSQL